MLKWKYFSCVLPGCLLLLLPHAVAAVNDAITNETVAVTKTSENPAMPVALSPGSAVVTNETDSGGSAAALPQTTAHQEPAVSSATSAGNSDLSGKTSEKPWVFSPFKKKKSAAAESPHEKTVVKPARGSRYFLQAAELYAAGELDDAADAVRMALKHDPRDRNALDLQRKIAKVKERVSVSKFNLANEYFYNAGIFLKKGQILEALLEVKRAIDLDPESREIKALYLDICQVNQNVIDRLPRRTRRPFRKAIASFIDGDYAAAAESFRKLMGRVPEADSYLPVAETHIFDRDNKGRSDAYFVEAINDMRKGKFQDAQDKLYLALEIDRHNNKARLMLEQVDLELMGE